MPLDDRDYIRGKHPPYCTCVDCVNKRLHNPSALPLDSRFTTNPIIPNPTAQKEIENMHIKKPRNITHGILIGIAIIFALLTGLSVMAWLLPTTFNSFGNALIRITGNKDIQLNVIRISNDPIPYAISFGILGLVMRWLANKF